LKRSGQVAVFTQSAATSIPYATGADYGHILGENIFTFGRMSPLLKET
jgi:hypothetical protein